MKILLLEDNDRLNKSITKRFDAKGYQVDSFADGALAKEAIKNNPAFRH